jgi:hypothetical protein
VQLNFENLRKDNQRLLAKLAGREATIRRLRVILGNVPLTADNVPVTPGMDVWSWLCINGIDDGPIYEAQMPALRYLRPGTYECCYSTREAAESGLAKARRKL